MVGLLEASELLNCLVCLIRLQTVWLPHQFMLFSTSVTIWWRPWDFHCPLSHLSDCSHKQCAACFPQGMKLYVCAWCIFVCLSECSWSATENDLWHDLYNTAPNPTVQLLKIHSACAVTSATTSMNHAVHKNAGKRSTRRRTTVATLQSLSCPWCWEQGWMCDTEWDRQQQRACLLSCPRLYYPAWNIYRWGLDCRDVRKVHQVGVR